MEFTFRIATAGDLDLLVETRLEVLSAVFGLSGHTDMEAVKAESRRYYSENIASGGHVACLVFDGEDFAGCGGICLYRTMPMEYDPQALNGYIMNMYTRPQYRRRGIATRVLEILIGQAHRKGVRKITLETTDAARSLYRKAGFTDITDEMVYHLDRNVL